MSVSVIIPTLNEEEYMPMLLKSLRPQLKKGDEIIVVDSHSRDKTTAIARAYGCRVIATPAQGIAAAKNAGAKKARNGVLAFLDADCVVSKHWLDRVKTHFSSRAHAVAGLDLYHAPSKRRQALYNSYSRSIYHAAQVFYKLGGKAWLPANNCAVQKKLFLDLGGYADVVCEDAELILRWPRHARVVYDPSMVVHLSDRRFREHGFGKTLGLWLVADIKAWLGNGIHAKKYKKIKKKKN